MRFRLRHTGVCCRCIAVVLACALSSFPSRAQAEIIYVDDTANGRADGSSWLHAFTELQAALALAVAGDDVWVAVGTYTPDFDVLLGQHDGNRERSFAMTSGVRILGGFSGVEVAESKRAGLFQQTILSGDLAGDDTMGQLQDNSLHVVTAEDVDSSALLDGFVVRSGFADGLTVPSGNGGGLLLLSSSPRVAHCIFTDHFAEFSGAAIAAFTSQPHISDCAFHRNVSAARGGGAHFQSESTATLLRCRFSDNVADRGGGLSIIASEVLVAECIFSGNAGGTGGAFHASQSSTPTIVHSLFAGNSALSGAGLASFGSSPAVLGCLFAGNVASSNAAIALSKQSTPLIAQSTVADNYAFEEVGGIGSDSGSQPAIVNSLLWGNVDENGTNDGESAQIWSSNPDDLTLSYTLVQNLDTLTGLAILGDDADLNPADAGVWTAAAQYDADTGFTTFRDAGAGRTPGAWIGSVLFANSSNPSGAVVADNTATELIVLGDFAGLGAVGTPYMLRDYRLGELSAAIDAGSNSAIPDDLGDVDGDGILLEPLPLDLGGSDRRVDIMEVPDCPQRNGNCGSAPIVDMGAYEHQDFMDAGEIIASSPSDGAIDARQPSNLDGNNPSGWERVILAFSGSTASLSPSAFEISTNGGPPPTISSISSRGSGAILHFDGPLAPGSCTRILHLASGTGVTLGYLPADVNSDGSSGPLDILALIDGLNGVVEHQDWNCDIDRSASCSPLDILRLIDLLNGAAAFDVWNGANLPACP